VNQFVQEGRASRWVGVIALLVTAIYLTWRLLTLSLGSAEVLFFLLELYGGLSFLLFVFSTWDPNSLAKPGPVPSSVGRVAVCITTYNEDEHVLLPTVAAAVALPHDHETWVLDDGDRPWVRHLAESLGATYLARQDNKDAKAGNINHALTVIDAEFVAFLDADHIPAEGFLVRTLGYFSDPSVALVQTPQDFYNLESFEHIGNYQEEAMFYRVIQPGKNRWKAAFWCGTSAVVRTEALRQIGGVATDSVTEDLLTTIRLHGKGWHTVFHNEVLAQGLAPASYREYQTQRNRWAVGAMQVLRSRDNPLIARGLSLPQRLAFTASLTGWFEGLRTFGYVVLAASVVLTGSLPISVDPFRFVLFHIAVLASTTSAQLLLGRNRHQILPALLFEFLRIPTSLAAASQLLSGGRSGFQVTPKGQAGTKRLRSEVPASLLLLAGLTVGGLFVYAATAASLVGGPTGRHVDITAAVLVLNLALLSAAFHRIHRQDFGDERRRARRFERQMRFVLDGVEGTLLNPSTTGAHISGQVRTGNHSLEVFTREGPILMRCWITPDDKGGSTVEFAPGQFAERGVLARTLYSDCLPIAVVPPERRVISPASERSDQAAQPEVPPSRRGTDPIETSDRSQLADGG